MTVSKEEILQIIEKRETKIEDWLENNPQKLPILKLKRVVQEWQKEVIDARKFSKENDPTFPKEEFLCVYTMMNEYSAYRSYYIASQFNIKKLENHRKTQARK